MKRRRIFKRVILPAIWLLIGSVIAVSLAVLAFGGGRLGGGDEVTPTADMSGASETATVETGSVSNSLTLKGSIAHDPAVDAKLPTSGTVSAIFAPNGAKVGANAPLFEVKIADDQVEAEPQASSDKASGSDASDEPSPQPATTYHYTSVRAPIAGRVTGLTLAVGDEVGETSAVSIQPTTFHAQGTVTALDRYRLLDLPDKAKVTIDGGPAPFSCWDLTISDEVTATTSAGSDTTSGSDDAAPEAQTGSGAQVTCKVPDKVTVFDGLDMSMTIDAGATADALIVPVTAVRGLVQKGTVWVVGDDGGEPTERRVRLGVSDGKVIAVTSGLEKGENILRYVPGSENRSDDPNSPEAVAQ